MKLAMRCAFGFALSALILISGAATTPAQDNAAPKSPSEIVTTLSFVSLDPVPRGK